VHDVVHYIVHYIVHYMVHYIVTAPRVVYQVHMNDGSIVDCDSPAKLCESELRQKVTEPYVAMEIFCPQEYSGAQESEA